MNYFSRRSALILAAITIPLAVFSSPLFAINQQVESTSVHTKLAELEATSGGRIGLSAINTANNVRIQYRANERFPVTSTFKVLAVSAILKQSMTESDFLQRRVTYNKEDLVPWSPITEKHVADGMSVFELCAATIQYSDNTAVNLLMKLLGGPEKVTQFARSIGDETFRLDRWETELNSAIPGDLRDTSTPAAMEKSLQQLATGNGLGLEQRQQLLTWLKGNTTGDQYLGRRT